MEVLDKTGLVINRKCGLAPCTFDDELMAKGLGMNCDRSKENYSCTFCCKGDGCNRNGASSKRTWSRIFLLAGIVFVCILNVAKDFIPPYVMAENTNFKK